MLKIKDVIRSNGQPHNGNVLWLDTTTNTLKYCNGSDWVPVQDDLYRQVALPVLDITDLSKYGEFYWQSDAMTTINNTTITTGTDKYIDVTDIFKKKFGTIDSLPSQCIIKMGETYYPFYYSESRQNDNPDIYGGDKLNERGYLSTISSRYGSAIFVQCTFGIFFYYYGTADTIMMEIYNEPFEANTGIEQPAKHIRSASSESTTDSTPETETDTPSTAEL